MKFFLIPLALTITANASGKRKRSSSDDENASFSSVHTTQGKHLRRLDTNLLATCDFATLKFSFDLESHRMITHNVRCGPFTYEYTGAFPNNFVGTIKTAPDGTESSNKASSLSIDPFSLEQLDGNWWAMDNKANICLEVLNILLTRHRVSTMEDLLTKMCEVYTKAIRAPTARSALPRMRKDEPMDM